MNVLVVTAQYAVGGKERHVAEYASFLSQGDVQFVLLTEEVHCDRSDTAVFEGIITADFTRRPEEIAEEILRAYPIECVWSQGDSLMTAHELSKVLRVPLVVTIHNLPSWHLTSLKTDDYTILADLQENQTPVVCISDEIAAEMRLRFPRMNIHIIKNPIRFISSAFQNRYNWSRPKRWVLISRSKKQNHMRAAVRMFAMYWFGNQDAKLTIITDVKVKQEAVHSASMSCKPQVGVLICVLGLKWLLNHPLVSLSILLGRVSVVPHGVHNESLVADAEMVVGMGRVVLEGLAVNKTTVLVGYDGVRDVLDENNFGLYDANNLSGRGTEPSPIKSIVRRIESLTESPSSRIYERGLLSRYDVKRSSVQMGDLFRLSCRTVEVSPVSPVETLAQSQMR